jgi:lysophospholipase L1-like esterase
MRSSKASLETSQWNDIKVYCLTCLNWIWLIPELLAQFGQLGLQLSHGGGNGFTMLGNDGLHPNRDGYATMRPLAEAVIARAGR